MVIHEDLQKRKNFARRFRPTSFKAVVGQDLTIKLLKNSLYKQRFFPVYLFSGQFGSGKTTTGRIFAAAINCDLLSQFLKEPQLVEIPCGNCHGCQLMQCGSHPDFIEIDAASHTGVENVRNIIEHAAFIPQYGKKKIYLIDESHMLSKAAFNALLKILEEPPVSALFLLVTTDIQKIPDTVRSRCFQLFFDPLSVETIHTALVSVCEHENIQYTMDGLAIIAREASGSMRDALNILERIILIEQIVCEESVQLLFGFIPDERIIKLVSLCVESKHIEISSFIKTLVLHHQTIISLWKRIAFCFQDLLMIKHRLEVTHMKTQKPFLEELSLLVTVPQIIHSLELMMMMEQSILKSSTSFIFFELFCLKLGKFFIKSDSSTENIVEKTKNQVLHKESLTILSKNQQIPPNNTQYWQQFLSKISSIDDTILISIFKQAQCNMNDNNDQWNIGIPHEFILFEHLVNKYKTAIEALIFDILSKKITVTVFFDHKIKAVIQKKLPQKEVSAVTTQQLGGEKAQLIMKTFPGVLTELKE